MATRSRIGIQLADESILSVYHHWDGYPQWLGRILKTHYNSKSKIGDQIDGGDMSCCWTKDRWTGKQIAPYVTEQKESEEYGPQYYAQRGEDCPPVLHTNLNDFLTYTDDNCGGEYAYVFNNGEWTCHQVGYSVDPHMTREVEIPDGALAV